MLVGARCIGTFVGCACSACLLTLRTRTSGCSCIISAGENSSFSFLGFFGGNILFSLCAVRIFDKPNIGLAGGSSFYFSRLGGLLFGLCRFAILLAFCGLFFFLLGGLVYLFGLDRFHLGSGLFNNRFCLFRLGNFHGFFFRFGCFDHFHLGFFCLDFLHFGLDFHFFCDCFCSFFFKSKFAQLSHLCLD